ncbi:class I SAM-dependent methyltransferase [Mucilaginibacter lappiensis]|jgi:SAM-dependent methyltransferase|uniref:class I SAM-dependent methyltransferase n=1 Tax=Mucilaginibacter lappiensis TaxID=354630 RepID=UPI003D240576
MRKENIGRLNTTHIALDDQYYLHYKYYHQDLFNAFSKYGSGKLLDIGCGNKPYGEILKPYITEYIGCDIIQSSENRADIICPANNIPLSIGSFDTVISTQTIEHVEDPQGLVNEAYRLLKKDGHFIVSGPMYWPLHEEPYDFFRFTKHGFKYIMEKAGFSVITINSNGGKWSVVGQAFIHALFPLIYQIQGIKGKFARFFFKLTGGVKTINKIFSYLDNRFKDHTNTMNYVVVAKKK